MWLLLLMILIMPFEKSPYLKIADSFGGFQELTVIKLVGLAGFAWALIKIASGEYREGILASRQARMFLLFYCGVVLAFLIHGTGFIVLQRYLAFLLFMPFVLVSVRTERDVRLVLMAVVASFVLAFPYALRQLWRYGGRLGVGLYESNYFAANIVLVMPVAFAIARLQLEARKRMLWIAAGLLLVLSLYLTSSRGGFLGLVVAAVLFAYRHRGLGGAVGVLAILVLLALPTDLGRRAMSTFTEQDVVPYGLSYSNRAHEALFWAGLGMIADEPLFGIGPENFKPLSTYYTGLTISNIAHNSYLEIGAEMGLPVLAIFVVLLVVTFRALSRVARMRGDADMRALAGLAEGMRIGLIGFLVAGTFISAQYEKLFWLFVFLSIPLERFARRRALAAAAAAETADTAPTEPATTEPESERPEPAWAR
jgi:O-antigen ligase